MKKYFVIFASVILCGLLAFGLYFALQHETLSDVHIITVLRSPENIFWAEVWDGLRQQAQECGITVSEYPYEDISKVSSYLEIVGYTKADAVIIGITDSEMIDNYGCYLTQLRNNGTKVIAVDTDPGEEYRDCFIGLDNLKVGKRLAEEAIEHLPEDGRILILIGDSSSPTNKQRFDGCYNALQDMDMLARTDTLVFLADNISTIPPFREYLNNTTTPLLIISIGPNRTLMAANIISKMPDNDHIQIIGFGESDEALAYVNDGTIDVLFMQNNKKLGELAVEKALALLSGETNIDENGNLLLVTQHHPEGQPIDIE